MPREFTEGGELGALISEHDWSATALGPIESWSPALRMMVRFLLANRFPMLLWWGPDYICLYNEPYSWILGDKHPWALGRPVREVWSEIWHQLQPLIDTPYHGGPATWNEALLFELRRRGYLEETHFTFAYSPVPDDAAPGGIGGVLATVSEVSEKVVAQRRALALRDLGARAGDAKTAAEACAAAARTLQGYAKDLPFVLFYLVDGPRLALAGAAGAHGCDALCPAYVDLNAPGPWPFAEVLRTETAQVVEDLQGRFREVPRGPWSDPPSRAIVTAIPSSLPGAPAGVMIAGVSSRLELDGFYRDFVDLVRGQVASAIGHAQAFDHQRARAEELAAIDRAKTAFFANVSHEFRTPLALMLGPLEDLVEGDQLAPRARADVELVHRSALRLQKLVNNLLDFARLEAGRAEAWFVPTDLAALTSELASTFRSAFERAGLEFIVDCAPVPPVHVDRAMWEKIVLNLLSNALKYTQAGRVEVRLTEAHGRAELSVRDTGAGIAAEHLPRVFERFHRVPGTQARSVEGSGIGLALVAELTRLHGGTITANSAAGEGSTFTLSLPFGAAHLPPEKVGATGDTAPVASMHQAYVQEALGWLSAPQSATSSLPVEELPQILIADDNADMRGYLRRLLEDRYRVIAVSDGNAALEIARSRDVELLISDVMMPGLDGFALLAALRADERTRSVPVILLSARAGEEARIEGLQAGADDYLVKPFAARELRARVDAHVQRLRMRRRWQELWEQSPALVAVLRGPTHVFELANAAYAASIGKPADSLVGKPIRDALPELDGQGWFELLDQVYARGEQHLETEVRRVVPGAAGPEERWFNSLNFPTRDRDGNVDGIVIQSVDVTALVSSRRQAQAMATALQEHGAWLHDVLDLAPVAIQLLDPKARVVTFANRIATELSSSAPLVWADLHARLHAGDELDGVEVSWASNAGPRWMLAYGHLLPAAHGQAATAVLVCQEITAIKRVEEHLRHTQKLEAIAKLAGGVAHEFNNLLTVVVGNAALMMDEDLDPSVRGMAEEIQAAADRAAMLTSYLLAFGRKQILRPELLSLSELVKRVHPMLRGVLPGTIQLEVELAPDLPMVRADATHLEHVLMNLVLNARDAMPGGGTVRLKTSVEPDDLVGLAVADTGTGIPDEVKARVFEPFFTTKPIGQGTGLGLSMCEGIVTQTGGRISLDTAPGRGTTVSVLLPRAGATPRPPATSVPRAPAIVTVLLVEDEKPVLRLATSILSRSGFQVLAASGAEEALAMSRRYPGDVHVLVSDVGLPNMSGPELYTALRQERPALKVLFISGLTGHDDEEVLPKPFTPENLRRKVREVLDGA